MLAALPKDLTNLVTLFAYNATLEQTKKSLKYVLRVKNLDLHPVAVAQYVNDYSTHSHLMYDRQTQESKYFSAWCTHLRLTPLREFFVWYARADLFAQFRVACLIDDLDFRTVKKYLSNCPISVSRNAKLCLVRWIYSNPLDASVYTSKLFRKVGLSELRLYPTALSRYLLSDSQSTIDWSSPVPLYM